MFTKYRTSILFQERSAEIQLEYLRLSRRSGANLAATRGYLDEALSMNVQDCHSGLKAVASVRRHRRAKKQR